MSRGLHRLPLEKPIYEIEDRIAALEAAPLGALQQEEVRRLKRELVEIQKRVFSGLDPWQTVEVARHPDRPKTSDYVSQVFDEFVELHGDKSFGDDPPNSDDEKYSSSATKKGKRSPNARPVTSAAPIRRATARRWARCGWRRSTACR